MLYIVLFYGVILSILVGVGTLLFRWLRRWGLAYALAASLFTLAVSVLTWPIPIHGGFLLLGQVIYEEWSRDREMALRQQQ